MFKNLFFNIGSKGIVIVSQFVSLILTNHIIGPEGRGVFLAAITWSNTFYILTHCSLHTGILHLTHKSIEKVNNLAYTSTIIAMVLGFTSVILAFLIYGIVPGLFNNLNFKYFALALVPIPFMMLQQYSMSIFQVKGEFKVFNILYASYAVLNLFGIVLIWFMHKTSLELLIYINLLAWVLTGIIAIYFCWPMLKKQRLIRNLFSELVKTSITAHFNAIVTFVIMRSDILIINYFSSEKETGIYGLAVGIVQMLLIVPLSMQNLIYFSLMEKSEFEQKRILLQYSRITVTVMLTAAICIFLFSQPLVHLVGGESFEEAIPLFKYFLPGVVLYSIPMILSAKWVIKGLFRQLNIASFFVLVLSLVSNIFLVPIIGITGGAITFLFISFIIFCFHIWLVGKNLGNTAISEIIFLKKNDVKSILASIMKAD